MDTYEGNRGTPLTLNKYIYADSNPVMGVDPTGLFTSLADVQTAMKIRNTLAGVQSSSYNYLISATLRKGDYDFGDFSKEFGFQALFTLVSIAIPFLFRAILQKADDSIAFGGRSALFGNPKEAAFVNRIPSTKGFHDVIVHGSPSGFHYNAGGKWSTLKPNTLATFVKKGNYQGGNIRLISCETGAEGAVAAQNFANKMKVDVLAPTDKVWVYSNGTMTVGPKPGANTGTWKIFTPQNLP
jgi:hypothetical protein